MPCSWPQPCWLPISIPIGTAANTFTYTTGGITAIAKQNGLEVGKVTVSESATDTIVIGPRDDETRPIVAAETVTVTISGLKNPLTNGNYPINLGQQDPGDTLTTYTLVPVPQPSVDVYKGLTDADASVKPSTPGADGVTMTVEFTPGETGAGNDVVITLPTGYTLEGGLTDALPSANQKITPFGLQAGANITTTASVITVPGPRLTVGTAVKLVIGPSDAPGVPPGGLTNPTAGTKEVTFQAGTRTEVKDTFDVAPASVEYKATTKTEPGSNQSLTVRGYVEYASSDSITVNFDKFGVPGSIDVDHVVVSVGNNDANPSDVEIDGKKVTLVAPFEYEDADSATQRLAAENTELTTITFRRSADITLPTLHKEYDIKVSTSESPEGDAEAEKGVGGDGVKNIVDVQRQVKVKPTSGTRGTEITVTGKGFADGSATLRIEGNVRTGSLDVVDGAFTYTVLTDVKNTSDDNVFEMGENEITVSDSRGQGAPAAVHTVKASFSIEPEEISPGEKVVITLKDAPDGVKPSIVRFAGDLTTQVTTSNIDDADDGKDTTWEVTVPDLGRTGSLEMRIVLPGDADDLTKNVMVATKDLTLSPSTAVAGQDVTIQGSGFSGTGDGDTSVTIDGGPALDDTDEITVDSGGSMSVTITLPESAKAGDRRIQFTDTVGRIGRAFLTIPKATLSVGPAESLIGSNITVSGVGFPANDLVQITYAEGPGAAAADRPVGTAATGPSGEFETTIRVPSFALTGETHKMEATSQLARDEDNRVSAKSKHSTPDPDVTFSPTQVEAGGLVTITGVNFTGFRAVEGLTLGEASILPTPAPTTDSNGGFTASDVLIPQLDPGNYTVKITVGDDIVTKFLAIVEAVAPNDPADVFASLGDRLVRVWAFDASAQATGNAWSFYDPDPQFAGFNTLTQVSSGDIVTIIIGDGETVEFASNPSTLYPGSNYVALD